jgi:hypothetical protein
MMGRGSGAGLTAALAAALAVAAAVPASAAGAGADPADRCLEIADAGQRLACFEAVQRSRHEAAAPAAAPAAARPGPEARRGFGLPAPRLPRRHGPVEGEDQVTVRLAEVGRTHDRMLWFRTTDGAVWSQDDPTLVEIAPRVDAKVKIRRSALGGYFCDMTRWQSVRCRRVEAPPQ